MFGKNISPKALIAPGEKVIDGSTSDATPAAFHLVETGASFLSTVREFDLAVKDPAGTPVSTLVREVVSDTDLETFVNRDFNAVTYDIIRPSEAVFRPGEGVECTVHSVIANNIGDYNPAIVFMTDGERLVEVGRSKVDGSSNFLGLDLRGQNLKINYKKWLVVFNYSLRSLPVELQGINKTVQEVGV